MDHALLVGYGLTSYVSIILGIIACGNYLGHRIREFATECMLEKQRQNELIEKLLQSQYDNEQNYYYGDVEDEPATEEPDAAL